MPFFSPVWFDQPKQVDKYCRELALKCQVWLILFMKVSISLDCRWSLKTEWRQACCSETGKKKKNPLRMSPVVTWGKEYFRTVPDKFKTKSSVRFSELCKLCFLQNPKPGNLNLILERVADAGTSMPLSSCEEGRIFLRRGFFSEQNLLIKKKTKTQWASYWKSAYINWCRPKI